MTQILHDHMYVRMFMYFYVYLYSTTRTARVVVYGVIQGLYHQQYGTVGCFWLSGEALPEGIGLLLGVGPV